ncbi:MAG TPA: efflux RND transporter periplasmic adaptor subunit [Steroidobacteraceae bacterium]|nr:efflux RND transporter periplasmic adaptor subunit [Steroidobacteraceae bacterium]
MSISLREGSSIGMSRRVGSHLIWGVLIAVVALGAVLLMRLTHGSAATPPAAGAKLNVPTVSVTAVRRSVVPTTVSIIGNIAARYDTPIGVEGDGGRVAAIYVEAGDRVHRGQVLARINDSVIKPQVSNLEAALELAKAEADLAAAEYRRALALGGAGALSKEETERRRSSSVTAAAKVKVAAAQLAEAEARLARTEVRAPADGLLLTRTVEVGQTVAPGGPALFRMAEGDEVELRGEVAEQDLPLLKVGQSVRVKLTGSSQVFEGKVRLLGAVIDPQTRLGMVRIALKPDPNLRPGAFARAEVLVNNAEQIVLPQTAVLSDDKGSYVLVVGADHRIERRTVRVAGFAGGGVAVAGALEDRDEIVSTAGAFLQEGEVVKTVERTGS